MVLVVVSWTRLRHQHSRRDSRRGARDSPAQGLNAEQQQEIYGEGVYSGRAGSEGRRCRLGVRGRGSAGRYVQVRSRPWGCARWEAALTAEHARLEAMVLRARRGTHQGSVDNAGRPAGMQRKGEGLVNRGMRAVGSFYMGGAQHSGRAREAWRAGDGVHASAGWSARRRVDVCLCRRGGDATRRRCRGRRAASREPRESTAVAEPSGDGDRQLRTSVRWGRPALGFRCQASASGQAARPGKTRAATSAARTQPSHARRRVQSQARGLEGSRTWQPSQGAHCGLGRRGAALACAKGESGIDAAAQSGRSI